MAMDRGEEPKVEMHWETNRFQGKERAWWTGFCILYRDKSGNMHPLHSEIGKIPVPEDHEAEEIRVLSLSKAIPMLLVRFFQELFTI